MLIHDLSARGHPPCKDGGSCASLRSPHLGILPGAHVPPEAGCRKPPARRMRHEWRPGATLDNLRLRARLLAAVRDFFAERGVLEVDTPLLYPATVTDPHIQSFTTQYTGPGAAAGRTLYLQTSPEFAMKRLLAAGSGPIYQLGKVFRNGEAGRRHNPEFTLLEWYRPDFELADLMSEVDALVRYVVGTSLALGPAQHLSYAEAFIRYVGIDPHTVSDDALRQCATHHGIAPVMGLAANERDGWLDLLLTHIIEPQLGQGCPLFLFDYPPSQAALARIRPGNPAVAERFELYIQGMELANGYYELGDAIEQQRRFEVDCAKRHTAGLPSLPLDERLLAALDAGLPECCGVALGVDRLIMLAAGVSAIDDIMAFPLERL